MIEHYKQYEPLFGDWRISKLIGKGSFGEVYEIERSNFGTTYKAALKVITIPIDESELQELMSSGMSAFETKQYIKQSAKDIVNEFVLMSKLKGNTNIVSYEDHQVIEHEDKLGWDIMMKMELLEPISKYIKQKGFTKKALIKLGIDLCTALELCEKYNIVHRDIKPENIFVSPNGDFKLGDFGIARSIEKATLGLSKKGTYTYMAPEVYKGENYTTTVDIYSLGIVMYKFMNCNRIPFMPPYPQPIVYTDRENALAKRVSGEKLPVPNGVKEGKLIDIVFKACQFDPNERYQNATQMKEELMKLLDTEEDAIILAPTKELSKPKDKKKSKQKSKQDKIAPVEENVEEKEEIEKTLLIDREELVPSPETKEMKSKFKKKRRLIVVVALIVAMIGIMSGVNRILDDYNKLKAEESAAKSSEILVEPSQGRVDAEIPEQTSGNEIAEKEDVKPGEEVKQEEVKENKANEEEPLKEEVAETKEEPEEETKQETKQETKEEPKQEQPKVEPKSQVKEPVKVEPETSVKETPVQETPTPNKPPEIYIEFEE